MWIRRLICTFVVRLWHKQVFSWCGSNFGYCWNIYLMFNLQRACMGIRPPFTSLYDWRSSKFEIQDYTETGISLISHTRNWENLFMPYANSSLSTAQHSLHCTTLTPFKIPPTQFSQHINLFLYRKKYHNAPKFLERQVWPNNLDPVHGSLIRA